MHAPNEAWSPLARIDHMAAGERRDVLWFNTDINGAPLEVTDERGDIRWSGQYGSFGEVRRQAEGFTRLAKQSALPHQPLRYAGQYADSETSLHYNLFRYYDPQVGRFTVQDPIGLEGGWNLYQYAPNPLSWMDPLGLNNLSTAFKAMFREAKRKLDIPKNTNTPQAVKIFDFKYENRTAWEFNHSGDKKYIIMHEDDIFCRDPHLHTADNLHENLLEKNVRYNQHPGHIPENKIGITDMREKKMPLTLQEKLKEAQKKGQLKKMIELIIAETGVREDSIEVCSISYQSIIDHVYDLLLLENEVYDINTQKSNFEKFIDSISGFEYLITYFMTENNIFFLKLPSQAIKESQELFWDSKKIMGNSRDRIFIKEDFSRGFVVLSSEYGIEKAEW